MTKCPFGKVGARGVTKCPFGKVGAKGVTESPFWGKGLRVGNVIERLFRKGGAEVFLLYPFLKGKVARSAEWGLKQ